MMCTQPITIKNPRTTFIPFVDRKYFKVPCGKCLECRNKKRNELYLLSYFEYLNAKYRNGFTQFFTLTYDDEHLPTFGFRPCFSREDVRKYFYRVRSACRRKFGKDFKLRYLITCEYGSTNKRPHYHFLVFVQQSCNHFLFRKILRDCWQYGFSFGSWDNFGEVNRPNGIRYVTKYVCKDTFDDSQERAWLDTLDDKEIPTKLLYHARKHCTFTLYSHGFGFCMLDHILKDYSFIPKYFQTDYETILKTGCIAAPCGPNGVTTKVPLPRSIYRKLFFNITYRYKRVTKRDVNLCYEHGTKIPKYRVQTFFIPNIHYKERYPYEVKRKIEVTKNNLKLYANLDSSSLALRAVLRPPYTALDIHSNMTDDELFNKLCTIKMERDPIFGRCPFTKEFFYERAPLERTDFPDIREKMFSLYSFDSSAKLRYYDKMVYKDKLLSIPEYFKIEKTYRDNKLVNTA